MKIGVLDIAASKTGALTILRDFYGYVAEHGDPQDQWVFITGVKDLLEDKGRDNISIITREDVKSSSKARLYFDLISGGKWLESLGFDALISFQNTIPKGLDSRMRKILYIHQPLGFQKAKRFSLFDKSERPLALYQRFYHRLILSSAKASDISIVQTEWMRQALLRDTGLPEDRVVKIMPDIPDLSGYRDGSPMDPGKFFYPASDLPYKNHAVIERAKEILAAKGLEPEVIYTKDASLSREEVYGLYNRSALLFPSYIETFGLPLAEACQFGVPVIAADTEFAREILAGYDNAVFFPPFDEGALAEAMERVIRGEMVKKEPQVRTKEKNSYGRIVEIIRNEGQDNK